MVRGLLGWLGSGGLVRVRVRGLVRVRVRWLVIVGVKGWVIQY